VVIGAKLVDDNDEVMLITTGGVLIRTRVARKSAAWAGQRRA
jgi:DNA gyrase subunit A